MIEFLEIAGPVVGFLVVVITVANRFTRVEVKLDSVTGSVDRLTSAMERTFEKNSNQHRDLYKEQKDLGERVAVIEGSK